jgi:hypothetical protein
LYGWATWATEGGPKFLSGSSEGCFCFLKELFNSGCIVLVWRVWGFRGASTVEMDLVIVMIDETKPFRVESDFLSFKTSSPVEWMEVFDKFFV